MVSRRTILGGLGTAAVAVGLGTWWSTRPSGTRAGSAPTPRGDGAKRPPNIVLILADDQGYNDVSCFWQPDPAGAFPRIETPNLDSLASDGIRLDTFYAGASVCTPARAALMTGCYPPRVGFGHKSGGVGVLGPGSTGGLAPTERALAEVLREAGYATGCVGKWHLGGATPHLPTDHGFDGFYGIPWSNNQSPLPLMRDSDVVRMLPENPILTGQFTIAALSFIEQSKDRPFFLYLAHSAPHWPWNVSPGNRGRAGSRGIYGDTIAELDASVGAVLQALDEHGLADDTLVLFFSDNGPYVDARTGLGGTNHPLRGAKAESWEGGVRTPFLARWPGVIPAGARRDDIATAMDLLPTLATIAGAPIQHPVDGGDIGGILRNEADARSPTDVLAYYARGRLEAVRDSRFKRVYANPLRRPEVQAALYDLQSDPGETTDVTSQHPEAVTHLDAAAEAFRVELGDALQDRRGAGQRGGGWEG